MLLDINLLDWFTRVRELINLDLEKLYEEEKNAARDSTNE